MTKDTGRSRKRLATPSVDLDRAGPDPASADVAQASWEINYTPRFVEMSEYILLTTMTRVTLPVNNYALIENQCFFKIKNCTYSILELILN